jgi:hypothetical protein
MALSTDQQASALVSAAHKAGIPVSVLVGVYGMESTFGSSHATSSAGAVGPFQFLPSTAAGRGYPLTNTPTAAQFGQQADAAAAYLAQLYKGHANNWDAALKAYSGGGYGQVDVAKKALKAPLDLLDAVLQQGISQGTGDTSITGGTPATKATQQVAGAASQVGDLIGMVTSAAFWIRVLEVIAGAALIAMGLRTLSGTTTTPITMAKGAARNASKAAVAL